MVVGLTYDFPNDPRGVFVACREQGVSGQLVPDRWISGSVGRFTRGNMSRRAKIEAQLEAAPRDCFLNYAWALVVAGQGEPALAVDRLLQVLEWEPQYVPAWFQLGQLQAQVGETDRARQTLVRGIEVARRAGDTHAEGEMRGFLESLG